MRSSPVQLKVLLSFSHLSSLVSVQVAARADQRPCDSKRPHVCLQNFARFRQVSSKPRVFAFDNDDDMIINLYVQMRFTICMHEIEPKALKALLAAAIRFMYDLQLVYMEEDGILG